MICTQANPRLTSLVQELKTVFASDGLVLTVAVAADPTKAENAHKLNKLVDYYLDWFNVLSFDYSGGFTRIDQPLYGKWDDSYPGHDHFQFMRQSSFTCRKE